jgi:glycosyltransferase involved in cell wall biosynthesis
VEVDVTIIDDASTDDSHRIARSLADNDARVVVLHHAQNQGHLRTANEAIASGSAPVLVKLDADDLLAPGALARAAALLESHPDVGFVYGRPLEFTGAPPEPRANGRPSWTIWSRGSWTEKVLRRAHNVIMQPEVMIRRDALAEVGGYSEHLPWAEDYHLWLRISERWSVGRVNGPVQGLYRNHVNSLQRSAADPRLTDLRARIAATREFLSVPRTGDRWRGIALRSLAREARRELAERRDDPSTNAATLAEYVQIATMLETEAGVGPYHGFTTMDGLSGRVARRVHGSMRWRRWRSTGL